MCCCSCLDELTGACILCSGFDSLLLRTLDLSRCCLANRHAGELCAALRGCRSLECLCLSYNGLEWEGARDISQMLLPKLSALTSLDLSHNGCGGWTHESCASSSAGLDSYSSVSASKRDSSAGESGDLLMRDWRHSDILTRSPPRNGCAMDGADRVGGSPKRAAGGRGGTNKHTCAQTHLDSDHRQRGIEYPVPSCYYCCCCCYYYYYYYYY